MSASVLRAYGPLAGRQGHASTKADIALAYRRSWGLRTGLAASVDDCAGNPRTGEGTCSSRSRPADRIRPLRDPGRRFAGSMVNVSDVAGWAAARRQWTSAVDRQP